MNTENSNIAENSAENLCETLTDSDVTAHTAAMWKYNPVPETPEPYPEFYSEEKSDDNFEVIAAAVRGKKHKHEGTNCDDNFALAIENGVVIAAVADGAGSKPFSRIGARAACEAAVKYAKARLAAIERGTPNYRELLGKPFDDEGFTAVCAEFAGLLRDSFTEAFAAVDAAFEKRKDIPEFEAAIGRKPELKDFSSTLLMTVAVPVETENGREFFTAALQLGDGMIAAIDENAEFENALIILGGADSGSFAGETEFITSEQTRTADSLKSRTKIRRGKITSLMLMTDGVADDYFPNSPQLLRLALDLKLNGILPINDGGISLMDEVKIPDPVAYPWVNDGDVKYALQYAKNIIAEGRFDLKGLWQRADVQRRASLEKFGIVHEKERAEMLKLWLDNYVERGSFDDRTLVLINVK
ncbi:MAG: protein phosphatase 2C domain-containing protein [Ruminococcus sp.]|nr:protein phosphatase 2C domain-containing protein [Ruminococcus sp.]MCM1382042.1 protein phosphatase 2C domain-containing protein [Muribaculaceae bacterium]MCM1478925.1 protein phosphatase 2C domain-containing protein [Muribaculaceae bacterium]